MEKIGKPATGSSTQPSDRRAHTRVRLELRCYSAGSSAGQVLARTVNVSRNGALLLWNVAAAGGQLPSAGQFLDVDLELPAGARSDKFIRCRGQVLRVQALENQPVRVAVQISQMSFVRRGHPVRARRAMRKPGLPEIVPDETVAAAGNPIRTRTATAEAAFGWLS